MIRLKLISSKRFTSDLARPQKANNLLHQGNGLRGKTPFSKYFRRTAYAGAAIGFLLFGIPYLNDTRAAVYSAVVTPMLHLLDPEEAHVLAIKAGRYGLYPVEAKSLNLDGNERLRVDFCGETLASPIGLAAGFDKNGEAVDALLDLGFATVEVGTVTPRPQPGNPKPRMFRLDKDEAAINRYGLNSQGSDAVKRNLLHRLQKHWRSEGLYECSGWPKEWQEWSVALKHYFTRPAVNMPGDVSIVDRLVSWKNSILNSASLPLDDCLERPNTTTESVESLTENCNMPFSLRKNKLLGVNVGKNSSSAVDSNDDYVTAIQKLGGLADYIVVNVSCPNVTNLSGGNMDSLRTTLTVARQALNSLERERKPLLFAKISPDLSDDQLQGVAQLALEGLVDGAVISNTTKSRSFDLLEDPALVNQTGGLSGKPLKELALQSIRKFYKLTSGKTPIIGVGGVSTAEDCIEFARAGASLVQLYTSFSYNGPSHITNLKLELSKLLESQGISWQSQIGLQN